MSVSGSINKGGDPYIFGRGGEEVEFLEKRGISVKCIPGITAASGIGAELGIPMTHRGIASSVRYITGHVREDGGDIEEVCVDAPHTNTASIPHQLPVIDTRKVAPRDYGWLCDIRCSIRLRWTKRQPL